MMKKAVRLSTITLAFVLFLYSQAYSTTATIDKSRDKMKEEIWALEEAYFANLYKADYAAVLAMVHSQFLGWPSTAPQPIDKQGSARFMKQLISKPTACTFKIERGGIRVLGEVALTQYTLYVNCSDPTGVTKTQSSRITHTWMKEGDRWKLLGGMSYDQ
ncbi:MAG: nuclear transport factor 2 family protein [Proteobacteria bacterium]|nr:nuclear transport factor 2 family protein [Pseudomonadota bacterium]